MRLWTIQKEEVVEVLEKDGVYRTDANLIREPHFLSSYDWLSKHLEEKDANPNGVSYPIWAWYRRDGKEKKPDLRRSEYETSGVKCVCIELEVPDKKVLLSDFDLWHYVLNNWWLDDSKNEEEFNELYKWFDTLPYEEREKLKRESWEKIFDIAFEKNDWYCKGKYVQAIFWELKREYIKKIQYFTAR